MNSLNVSARVFGPLFRFAFVLSAAAVVMFAGSEGHAVTTSDCANHPLAGQFKYGSDHEGKAYDLEIRQSGCDLTVIDGQTGARWQFDLTGKTETAVPREVIEANKDTELARRSLESMRIRMKLETQSAIIKVIVRENLPRVAGSRWANGNPIDVDVEFRGNIVLGAETGWADGKRTHYQLNWLGLYEGKVRVIKVNDKRFVGPLSTVFMSGANYVLSWSDGLIDRSLPFLDLRKIR